MAQSERKAKALIAAAIEWHDTEAMDDSLEKLSLLREAVLKYKAVQAVQLPEDPMAFHCPHCDADRPAYGWHLNAGDTGPFSVVYLTSFCGECKGILSVCVVTFTPAKELADQLMQQFKNRLVKPA